jgi:hypothetical protein
LQKAISSGNLGASDMKVFSRVLDVKVKVSEVFMLAVRVSYVKVEVSEVFRLAVRVSYVKLEVSEVFRLTTCFGCKG